MTSVETSSHFWDQDSDLGESTESEKFTGPSKTITVCMVTHPPTSLHPTMNPLPRVKLPTVRAPQPMPGDEILTSLRPDSLLGHPYPHRPTLVSLIFPTTHSLGTSSYLTYCSKSHLTYVTTDTHCSVSPASAATGAECLSNALLIGHKSRPSTLQSCLNCGWSGPEVCPSMQKYVIFLQNCTVNFHVCG